MNNGMIKTTTMQNILIQENGIIRNSKGYVIGRLSNDIDFISVHIYEEAEMIAYNEGIVFYLDTCLEFGKYQGETVADILADDPDYIEWLIDTFEVSEEVRNEI